MYAEAAGQVENVLGRGDDRLFQAMLFHADADEVKVFFQHNDPSCTFSMEHPIVEMLTKVYNEVMNHESRPFVMAGGNYAAYLPNAFGFSPGMPDGEFPPPIFRPGRGNYHQSDDSEDIEYTLNFMRVYAMSIAALEDMDSIKEN